MRNKGLFILIFSATCGILILFSYLTWKENLESVARPVERVEVAEEQDIDQEDLVEVVTETPKEESWSQLTGNMDFEVQKVFESRRDAGEKIQLLILASDLVDMGSPSMSDLLSEKLLAAYGEEIEISKQTFNEDSITITENDLIDYQGGFDVVLFEPFTLKNNGQVDIETEHAHITSIVDQFRDQVNDVAIVFTPSNPIYNATYYPVQIDALLTFLRENEYPVIEHWQNWPDPTDETIKDYLDENSRPNTKGAEAWAKAVISYFTGI